MEWQCLAVTDNLPRPINWNSCDCLGQRKMFQDLVIQSVNTLHLLFTGAEANRVIKQIDRSLGNIFFFVTQAVHNFFIRWTGKKKSGCDKLDFLMLCLFSIKHVIFFWSVGFWMWLKKSSHWTACSVQKQSNDEGKGATLSSHVRCSCKTYAC